MTVKAFAVLNPDGTIALAGLTTHLRIYETDDNNGAQTQDSPEAVVVPVEIITPAVLADKLAWLIAQQPNFTDSVQAKLLQTDINRLKWVLGEGPDIVMVPKL